MAIDKPPKTSTWIRVHIVYPLVPFFLEGAIRFISSGYVISLCTFNPAILAISLALLSIFVNQSILTHNLIIPNEQEKEDIIDWASKFMIYSMYAVAGFCMIVILVALKEFKNWNTAPIIKGFSWPIYFLSLVPVINAVRVQRSFKLRARI